MRCIITFLFSFLLFSSLSSQKFVDPDNEWNISDCQIIISNGQAICDNGRVRFKETPVLIDGMEYLGLVDDSLVVFGSTTHFYREDNGKVYSRNMLDSDDQLIYDFSLNQGDSIEIYWYKWIVEEVDSIQLLTGESRKRLKLTRPRNPSLDYSIYWIEGIGKADWAMHPFDFINDHSNRLNCFWSNGKLLMDFDNWHRVDCDLTLSQQETLSELTPSIYPNPAYEQLWIKDPSMYIKSATIYDIYGNVVKVKDEIAGDAIPIYDLVVGTYLLIIDYGNGELTTQRFVKM